MMSQKFKIFYGAIADSLLQNCEAMRDDFVYFLKKIKRKMVTYLKFQILV